MADDRPNGRALTRVSRGSKKKKRKCEKRETTTAVLRRRKKCVGGKYESFFLGKSTAELSFLMFPAKYDRCLINARCQ